MSVASSLATLAGQAEAWLAHLLAVRGLSLATVTSYGEDTRDFFLFLRELYGDGENGPQDGARPEGLPNDPVGPELLSEETILLYLSHSHARDHSPRTLARRLAALRSFFGHLMETGAIAVNPVEKNRNPKLPGHLPTFLSKEETGLLLAVPDRGTPKGRRDGCMLDTLYAAGLRVSELVELQLSGVDFQTGFLRVFGKGSKERLVPIHEQAQRSLADYIEHVRPVFAPKTQHVFVNRRGLPLTRQYVFTLVRDAARAVGITRPVSPHTLRHTFATHLLEGGADLRSVQSLLGHADISATEIYTHVQPSRLMGLHRHFHPRSGA